MTTESPYSILQKILSVPRERLSWWNLGVAAFARNFGMNAAEASQILSPCWQSGDESHEEDPEEILEDILSVPRENLSWWNVVVMAFSRENDVDAITASEILSECWDQGSAMADVDE